MRKLTFLWILAFSMVTLGSFAQTKNSSGKIDITEGSKSFLTIGGDSIVGSLLAEIHDNTNMQIKRFVNNVWQKQIFGTANKGSLLRINGVNYSSSGGYYFAGTSMVLISHTIISPNHVQSIWETTDVVRLTQDVYYTTGTANVRYAWTVTNLSSSAINDIRFFHGQDNTLNGSDMGYSAWDALRNSIIAYTTSGTDQIRLYFQGITVPFGYQGGSYSMCRSNAIAGALANTATETNVDQGYALEWRTESITASGSYMINAIEKFSTVAVTNIQVTAPLSGVVNAGGNTELTYQLQNLTAIATEVTLNSEATPASWTAAVQGGTTITLAANEIKNIIVKVTAPGNAEGTTASVILNAVDASGTASDFCSVTAEAALGCTDLEGFSNVFTLNVNPPLMDKLDAPNTITPNGDGINDYWIIPNAAALADYDLTIFNNLGATIYESKGYNNDWDCKYNGNELKSGTYYYVFVNGSSVFKGFITVIREKN
ncbi:MAG: gliding motility-associated C-terminal domain-containing protein [Salinivirgaceae bacterium]|nr:gliding motility-associated C-terminal domain-containing protein [Salinivirgaceae bacterium]